MAFLVQLCVALWKPVIRSRGGEIWCYLTNFTVSSAKVTIFLFLVTLQRIFFPPVLNRVSDSGGFYVIQLYPPSLLDVRTDLTRISIQLFSQWRVKSLKTIAQCYFFSPSPSYRNSTNPPLTSCTLCVCVWLCVFVCACAAIGWLGLLEGKAAVAAVKVQRRRSCWLRPSAPLFSSGCNPTPFSLHPPIPLSLQPGRQPIGWHQVLESGEPAVLNSTKLLSTPPLEPQWENWAAKCGRTQAHSRCRISAQSPPLTQTDVVRAVVTNQGGFNFQSTDCFRMWVCVCVQQLLPVVIVCICCTVAVCKILARRRGFFFLPKANWIFFYLHHL